MLDVIIGDMDSMEFYNHELPVSMQGAYDRRIDAYFNEIESEASRRFQRESLFDDPMNVKDTYDYGFEL